MNTRIQVEHPITEEITGVDLVREQLLIAYDGVLSLSQEDIAFRGHAIECRINAEDPDNNFFPSPGRIGRLAWPQGPGIRVDSGVVEGSVVTPFYDSMLAKLIVHADDRPTAITAALQALAATEIEGIKTTIPMHSKLLARSEFADVAHHSKFIETAPDMLEAS
jgi:acetyl-CoA carboxylase biotin carboxylase subunit